MQIFGAAFFFFFNFSKTAKAISYNPIQYQSLLHCITAMIPTFKSNYSIMIQDMLL